MSSSSSRSVAFGCRLNTYESEVMRAHAVAAGLGDAIIVNTCNVTAAAARDARQEIRKLRRANPNATIVVTGCAAQVAPDSFAAMPEVDHVIGNDAKMDAMTWQQLGAAALPRVVVNDMTVVRETAAHLVSGFEGHARAFVQVQNGCDHRCTFCVIPFGRGPSRSVPMGVIVDQVRTLVANGYAEVVLTGVDVTSYGGDLPGRPRLGEMARRLLALVPDLPRLRLSSLDPAEIDDDLWRLIADEPRLMPHLHLSLQAGDDMILKRMKRRHSCADAVALCARARALRPDILFGADLIAGFPTEDETMFANSLDIIAGCDLTWLHVFPYSARTGTPAAKMPQVPATVRKDRAARLRAAGAAQVRRHLAPMVGRCYDVVVERGGLGHTPHFAPVRLQGDAPVGALCRVQIMAHDDQILVGQVA